jgi:hypothetical protein
MCKPRISHEDIQYLDAEELDLLRDFAGKRYEVAVSAGRDEHSEFWGGLLEVIDDMPAWGAEQDAKFEDETLLRQGS